MSKLDIANTKNTDTRETIMKPSVNILRYVSNTLIVIQDTPG